MKSQTDSEIMNFVLWAQSIQPQALEYIKNEDYVFDDSGGKWEKLAFLLYTNLCEIELKARQLLEDDDDYDTQISEAYKTWGYDRQFDLVVEALAKLISAIQKWRRASFESNLENMALEVASVEIMLQELIGMMDQGELCKKDEFMSYLESLRSFKRYEMIEQLDPTEETE